MNNTAAALLGAVIGGLTVLVSSTVTNLVTLRNERTRHDEARAIAHAERLRDNIAVVFAEMFAFQHAINWITWFARHDPSALDRQMVSSYDDAIHRSYPKVLAAMAMVAALDLDTYNQLHAIMQKLYNLDQKVAIALRRLDADRETTVEVLRGYLEQAESMEVALPPALSRIMEASRSTR